MRRVAIIASASGNGKTTLGRALAARLGVRFVELDALVHGPNWTETPDAELRATLEPILARRRLGDRRRLRAQARHAGARRRRHDRLARPADARLAAPPDPPLQPPSAAREELWNGNRETWRDLFWGRESLIGYALTQQPRRRREWPARLAHHPVVRLRTPDEVRRWIAS